MSRRLTVLAIGVLCACSGGGESRAQPDTLAIAPPASRANREPTPNGTGFSDTSYAHLPAAQMIVAGLGIDTPEARVREVFGPPTNASAPEFNEMLGDTVSTWTWNSLSVQLADHKVLQIDCRSPRCITAAGIRPGSTRAHVVAAYGRGLPGYAASPDVLIYFWQGMDCSLVFTFRQDIVSEVSLQCDNS